MRIMRKESCQLLQICSASRSLSPVADKFASNSFNIVEFHDFAGCDFSYRTEPSGYPALGPFYPWPSLCLWIKCRIHHQAIDEHPKMWASNRARVRLVLTYVDCCECLWWPWKVLFSEWTICWFQFQVENPGQLWGPQNLVFCTKFHIVPLIFQVPGGHEQALLPEFPHTKLCKAAMNGPLPLSLLVSLDDINPTVSPLLALVFYCRVFIWRYWDKGWWNPQNQPKAKVKLPFRLCSSCWLSP